jgi:hypothetical protein
MVVHQQDFYDWISKQGELLKAEEGGSVVFDIGGGYGIDGDD